MKGKTRNEETIANCRLTLLEKLVEQLQDVGGVVVTEVASGHS